MYCKTETEINFLRYKQVHLRAEQYIHFKDAMHADTILGKLEQKMVLPATFTGGPHYMHEKFQDAMTYDRLYGRPDFLFPPHVISNGLTYAVTMIPIRNLMIIMI